MAECWETDAPGRQDGHANRGADVRQLSGVTDRGEREEKAPAPGIPDTGAKAAAETAAGGLGTEYATCLDLAEKAKLKQKKGGTMDFHDVDELAARLTVFELLLMELSRSLATEHPRTAAKWLASARDAQARIDLSTPQGRHIAQFLAELVAIQEQILAQKPQ